MFSGRISTEKYVSIYRALSLTPRFTACVKTRMDFEQRKFQPPRLRYGAFLFATRVPTTTFSKFRNPLFPVFAQSVQRCVQACEAAPQPFQHFHTTSTRRSTKNRETVETVPSPKKAPTPRLKQGVNESHRGRRRNVSYARPPLSVSIVS